MISVLRKYLFSDKAFYKSLLAIGIPIIIQNFLTSSLNLIDTLMVGRLGEGAIASVGVANQIFFILNFIMIGISAGCGIFISQYKGKGDVQGMRHSLGVSLLCSLAFGTLFMTLALAFPRPIISLFNQDPTFVENTRGYLAIVCLSYPLVALSNAFSFSLKNTGKTLPPMIASALGIATNIVLNYILIFGKFGTPALGIRGAALATLIARVLELILMISQVYLAKTVFAVSPRKFFGFSQAFFMQLIVPISHTVGNELIWTLGMVTYTVAYGKLGIESLAVAQIYSVLQSFFSIFFYGIANAAIVFIGREAGSGNLGRAHYLGKRLTMLAFVIAIFLCTAILILAPAIISLFDLTPEISRMAVLTLRFVAVPFIGFGLDTVLLTGVLRGGGDTKVPLVIEACTMWCIGVPLAFISCMVLKLPIYFAIPIVNLEEVLKAIIFTRRLLHKDWAVNMVGTSKAS